MSLNNIHEFIYKTNDWMGSSDAIGRRIKRSTDITNNDFGQKAFGPSTQ